MARPLLSNESASQSKLMLS